MTFKPFLDVLPDEQRKLWSSLADIPDSFVLYGGTALALRLRHRSSVDFDFFSSDAVDFDLLFRLPFMTRADVLQRAPDTLTVSTTPRSATNPVKVSFFGGIDTGRVGNPELTEDGVLRVASLLDLFGTKLKVLLQRVAARDYLDLAAILRAGVPLKEGLGAAGTLYGPRFPPTEAVKALSYFNEGDATNVDPATQAFLSKQAADWDFTTAEIVKVADSLA
ncbi:MAG: nucleotidyl transferase AbiEii/AbiGii toxin family protein [Deltaproteobacteria bacterium]|nr:nucleotidyl transferase AbiEii/AbiGii toxin family protein [Deltaproteobacteria bacterium]